MFFLTTNPHECTRICRQGDLPAGLQKCTRIITFGDAECHGILPTIARNSVTLSAVEASL
ncbi:MAG: hypothetical protein HUK16_01330 [Bacteroidales bacterium]|nr:hypothetical protein [Bacteroidales bacterium]